MNTLRNSLVSRPVQSIFNARLYCTSKKLPKNVIEEVYGTHPHIENGSVHDKKPFKVHLNEKKKYSWCLCGKGHSQPFCDGHHKNVHYKIKQIPVKFQVRRILC